MNVEQKALEVFLKLPEELRKILSKNKAFLAGGSILSGILDTKVNDYDLWFPDNSFLVSTYDDLMALGATIEWNSQNAWTLQLFDEFKIQCVKKHIGDPITILRGFDFKFCQVGINCANQELIQVDMTASQIKNKSKTYYQDYGWEPWRECSWPEAVRKNSREEGRAKNELRDCKNPEYEGEITPERYLKYFKKNLLHISVEAMIQIFYESKVKIPAWLMAGTRKLWVPNWIKDSFNNLHPPPEEKKTNTHTYY